MLGAAGRHDAAASAASADVGFLGLHDDVSDFGRCAVRTAYNLSAKDKPAADAGAERNHQNAVKTASAAEISLAERGHVRVVTRIYRTSGHRFHPVFHFNDTPAEVRAAVHRTVRKNRPGDTHADAENVFFLNLLFFRLRKNRLRDVT